MAFFAAMGAACSSVLGLEPPTLDPCTGGGSCVDANAPPTTEGGGPPGNDATTPSPDAGAADVETPVLDTSVPPADVVPDRGPSDGIRCGSGPDAIFCGDPTPECCVLDDGGVPSYSCATSQSACTGNGGYGISCASDNDCTGSDICCVFSAKMQCDPESSSNPPNGACVGKVVCDPNGSSDQCPSGEHCNGTVDVTLNGDDLPLPYGLCQ